jgi:hypothetical protein
MAEEPDPVEAGGRRHEHASELREHARRADDSGGQRATAGDRHSRMVQVGEATLLALVTIAAAWAGYAAARWNTASRVDIAQSSTLRSLASRADLSALTTRNFDSSAFAAWFTAYTLNSPQKEAVAIRRFRTPFRVAFNAWLATDPLHNPHAPPGPTYMRQYKLPAQAKADVLDNAADAKFAAGNHDGTVSDDYIRITVFLAAVLFLVGISSSFKLYAIRYGLIAFGSAVLILAVVLILQQPDLPR